jgi:hypothetical protein
LTFAGGFDFQRRPGLGAYPRDGGDAKQQAKKIRGMGVGKVADLFPAVATGDGRQRLEDQDFSK